MNWTFETEELEHAIDLLMRLSEKEDREFLLCLMDKLSFANGWIDGVKIVMELRSEE